MVSDDSLLRCRDVAEWLNMKLGTVKTKRWQESVGLRRVKFGRTVRFRKEDVHALISRASGEKA